MKKSLRVGLSGIFMSVAAVAAGADMPDTPDMAEEPIVVEAERPSDGGVAKGATLDPEQIYTGRNGYNLMMKQIRDSLFQELPELEGQIDIVDHLASGQAEQARIAAALDISNSYTGTLLDFSNDEEGNARAGIAVPTKLEDGRYICVASGWDPDTASNPDDMTFDDIKTHARIILHEVSHCLDPLKQEQQDKKYDALTLPMAFHESEMFADLMAQGLLMENGDSYESTLGLAAHYNVDAPSRDKGGFYFGYDNGPELMILAERYQDQSSEGLQNFNITGWAEMLETVEHIRDQSSNTGIHETLYSRRQAHVLAQMESTVQQDAIAQHESHRDDIEDAFKAPLEDVVERFFNRFDFHAYDQGAFNDGHAGINKLGEVLDTARDAYHDWLAERSDYVPAAERIIASFEWQRAGSQADNIPDAFTSNTRPSFDQAIGLAALQYQKTGSTIDLDFVRGLSYLYKEEARVLGQTGGSTALLVSQQIMESPEAATALAEGAKLTDIVQQSPKAEGGGYSLKEAFQNAGQRQSLELNITPSKTPVQKPAVHRSPGA
ncbi:MAG: hypothetical protein ACQEQL_02775 [Pseudomonadota bacterium]